MRHLTQNELKTDLLADVASIMEYLALEPQKSATFRNIRYECYLSVSRSDDAITYLADLGMVEVEKTGEWIVRLK